MAAVRHSYGQQGHSNQVYKSLIYLTAQGALIFSSVAWLTDFSDAVKNPSTAKSFFKKTQLTVNINKSGNVLKNSFYTTYLA